MATSKVNIFNSLPQHASDSEDEDFQSKNKKTTGQSRSTKTDSKVVKKTTAPKEQKEDTTHQKDTRKAKGVSEQPHPLDRHSGTGSSAYGGKPKKGGAGKGNWGKSTEERETNEEAGDESPEKVEEEEKPEGITLQEYLSTQKRVESKPQVNQAKASITSEQLIKELGKSTLLKSKNKVAIDDHKVGTKKGHLDINHKAGIATDFADLLGFRTGFIEKDFKPRGEKGEREEGQRRAPRTEGNRRREDAKEEEKPVTEGTTTEAQQGEQPATTEEGQARRNEGQRGGDRRGGNRGGYKQGNRGDKPQGDRPRGDRPQGGRKPQDPKINIEDESAFPKLG